MMQGYVHKTTKIYRIWDFNGRGRAIESSNVYFIESDNAWTSQSLAQPTDPKEWESLFLADNDPDQTDKEHNEHKVIDQTSQHEYDAQDAGQDLLRLSRDSDVTSPIRECQPLGESMDRTRRGTEMSPNGPERESRNPEARSNDILETVKTKE